MCEERTVHAAKIVAIQEGEYAVRTLCELMEGEWAPEGVTRQSPLDDIVKAEAEGATQACNRCSRYLPASQAMQAHKAFRKERVPQKPEEDGQCERKSESGKQLGAMEAEQNLNDMD